MSVVTSTFLPSQPLINMWILPPEIQTPEDTQVPVAKRTPTQSLQIVWMSASSQSGHVDNIIYRHVGCQLSPPSEALSRGGGGGRQEAAILFTQLGFLQSISQEKHLEPLRGAQNLWKANSRCVGRESFSCQDHLSILN